jgi:hypothetical protein
MILILRIASVDIGGFVMTNRNEIRKLLKEPGSLFINLGGNSGVEKLLLALLNELDEMYKKIDGEGHGTEVVTDSQKRDRS